MNISSFIKNKKIKKKCMHLCEKEKKIYIYRKKNEEKKIIITQNKKKKKKQDALKDANRLS